MGVWHIKNGSCFHKSFTNCALFETDCVFKDPLKDHKVKISGKGLLLQCCWVAKIWPAV